MVKKSNIEMYSTLNERKSVIAERFFKTVKNKIYKFMISISKNVYIDKLDNIFNKYNNRYHRTIKMKPVDVKPSTYVDLGKEINDKDPKLKLVILLGYEKIKIFFSKSYVPYWSGEVFVIKNVNSTVPWICYEWS